MNREEKKRIINMEYLCATEEQYREWLEFARFNRPPLSSWFCTDGTPEYQQVMISKRLCVRPGIKFKKTLHDGLEGYYPTGGQHE